MIKKTSKQRFDIGQMVEEGGYMVMPNLILIYQEELGLDFTDIGILCKICSFSSDYTINFSKHFSSMAERTISKRLTKLRDLGLITTKKKNYKTAGGFVSGGYLVDITPLIEKLSFLNATQPDKITVDTPITQPDKIAEDTSILLEKTEEELIEDLEKIEFRKDMPMEDISRLENISVGFKKIAGKARQGLDIVEYRRLLGLQNRTLPFWQKEERFLSVVDKEAKKRKQVISALETPKQERKGNDNWLFYDKDCLNLVNQEDVALFYEAEEL